MMILRPAFQSHSSSLELTRIDELYNFLLVFHSNYGPISYCFLEKAIIAKKFPTPVYLMPPTEGLPWNLVTVMGLKKLERCSYQSVKEV